MMRPSRDRQGSLRTHGNLVAVARPRAWLLCRVFALINRAKRLSYWSVRRQRRRVRLVWPSRQAAFHGRGASRAENPGRWPETGNPSGLRYRRDSRLKVRCGVFDQNPPRERDLPGETKIWRFIRPPGGQEDAPIRAPRAVVTRAPRAVATRVPRALVTRVPRRVLTRVCRGCLPRTSRGKRLTRGLA
jgi:hypothetical protein